jgi:hypothetical protein
VLLVSTTGSLKLGAGHPVRQRVDLAFEHASPAGHCLERLADLDAVTIDVAGAREWAIDRGQSSAVTFTRRHLSSS